MRHVIVHRDHNIFLRVSPSIKKVSSFDRLSALKMAQETNNVNKGLAQMSSQCGFVQWINGPKGCIFTSQATVKGKQSKQKQEATLSSKWIKLSFSTKLSISQSKHKIKSVKIFWSLFRSLHVISESSALVTA